MSNVILGAGIFSLWSVCVTAVSSGIYWSHPPNKHPSVALRDTTSSGFIRVKMTAMSTQTRLPTPSQESPKCWTCRRKRVTCDGARPTCFKCKRTGRNCLGYGPNKPLVWVGLASRGRLAGRDFDDEAPSSSMVTQLAAKTITDPAFQDLGPRFKQYLFYCRSRLLNHHARRGP